MKKLIQILPILVLTLLLTSCDKDPQVKEGVSTFFLLIFFVMYMLFAGIPSIVFSALGIKSEKPAIYILAIVFTSLALIVSLMMTNMYGDLGRDANNNWMMFFVFIQYGTLIASIVMTAKGFSNRSKGLNTTNSNKQVDDVQFLDDIINGEDELNNEDELDM